MFSAEQFSCTLSKGPSARALAYQASSAAVAESLCTVSAAAKWPKAKHAAIISPQQQQPLFQVWEPDPLCKCMPPGQE